MTLQHRDMAIIVRPTCPNGTPDAYFGRQCCESALHNCVLQREAIARTLRLRSSVLHVRYKSQVESQITAIVALR